MTSKSQAPQNALAAPVGNFAGTWQWPQHDFTPKWMVKIVTPSIFWGNITYIINIYIYIYTVYIYIYIHCVYIYIYVSI